MTHPNDATSRIVAKLGKVQDIADAGRWALLDAKILLDEIEQDLKQASRERLARELQNLDLTGPGSDRAARDAEEYRPERSEDERP